MHFETTISAPSVAFFIARISMPYLKKTSKISDTSVSESTEYLLANHNVSTKGNKNQQYFSINKVSSQHSLLLNEKISKYFFSVRKYAKLSIFVTVKSSTDQKFSEESLVRDKFYCVLNVSMYKSFLKSID